MKTKTTKKQMIKNYRNIIRLGYCEIAYLLKYEEPRYYKSSVNGWDCDIYQINYNTIIVTGYRTFGNINLLGEDINDEYNNKARETDKEQTTLLLNEYITNHPSSTFYLTVDDFYKKSF